MQYYQLAQPRDSSLTQYGNMTIWSSCNINIPRSLNSRDSILRRKFENRAYADCILGPILSSSTISLELSAKMAEEIDLEECNFRKFRSSVTLTLTLVRVEVTRVPTFGRGLPTHQITSKAEKTFCGRTDGRTDGKSDMASNIRSIRTSPGNDIINGKLVNTVTWAKWVLAVMATAAPAA